MYKMHMTGMVFHVTVAPLPPLRVCVTKSFLATEWGYNRVKCFVCAMLYRSSGFQFFVVKKFSILQFWLEHENFLVSPKSD